MKKFGTFIGIVLCAVVFAVNNEFVKATVDAIVESARSGNIGMERSLCRTFVSIYGHEQGKKESTWSVKVSYKIDVLG